MPVHVTVAVTVTVTVTGTGTGVLRRLIVTWWRKSNAGYWQTAAGRAKIAGMHSACAQRLFSQYYANLRYATGIALLRDALPALSALPILLFSARYRLDHPPFSVSRDHVAPPTSVRP